MIAQRGAGVVRTEHPALLKQWHHLVDEWIEPTRGDVRDEDKSVAGVGLHQALIARRRSAATRRKIAVR